MKPEKYSLKQVATALRLGAGLCSKAAMRLKCNPETVRLYIKRHPELRDVVQEVTEVTLDLAEEKLVAAITAGEFAAVKFFLECRGKDRGYVRRHEVTGAGGGAIEVTDARERLLAELAQMGQRLAVSPPARPVTNGEALAADQAAAGTDAAEVQR